MRCQPGRRTLLFPLSIAFDSDLTANLSPALRAARVEAVCPSEAAVRAGNCAEGFRSTRNPSNPPHKVSGIPVPGGDGLRPAGLMIRGRYKQYRAFGLSQTSSPAAAVPLPHKARIRTSYKEKALMPGKGSGTLGVELAMLSGLRSPVSIKKAPDI